MIIVDFMTALRQNYLHSPSHISAALGKYALGIFPPIRPMDPGRWAPVGYKSDFLVAAKSCSECKSVPENCYCINEVSPEMVSKRVIQWLNKKSSPT